MKKSEIYISVLKYVSNDSKSYSKTNFRYFFDIFHFLTKKCVIGQFRKEVIFLQKNFSRIFLNIYTELLDLVFFWEKFLTNKPQLQRTFYQTFYLNILYKAFGLCILLEKFETNKFLARFIVFIVLVFLSFFHCAIKRTLD